MFLDQVGTSQERGSFPLVGVQPRDPYVPPKMLALALFISLSREGQVLSPQYATGAQFSHKILVRVLRGRHSGHLCFRDSEGLERSSGMPGIAVPGLLAVECPLLLRVGPPLPSL